MRHTPKCDILLPLRETNNCHTHLKLNWSSSWTTVILALRESQYSFFGTMLKTIFNQKGLKSNAALTDLHLMKLSK